MKALVTVWFWGVFAVTALVGFPLALLVFLVTAPFDSDRKVLHAYVCRWGALYLKLSPGWDIQILHRERLPRGAAVLVANHQSMADIVVSMMLFHPFKFVSKASLFSIPLLGWTMTALRYVRLERGRPRSTQQMIERCRRWLRRSMAVLLFPEGTYAPEGQLLPFKRGAFLLAIEEQVPLVPVLIEGTRSLVFEDGPWMNPRCRIRVTVLPPLLPAELGTEPTALAEKIRARFATELGLDARRGASAGRVEPEAVAEV